MEIIIFWAEFASDDREITGYNMWSNSNMESLNRMHPKDKGWLRLEGIGINGSFSKAISDSNR